MSERDDLERKLVNVVLPYVSGNDIDNLKMQLVVVLSEYEITGRRTEIVLRETDRTNEVLIKFLAAKAASGRSKRTVECYKNYITRSFLKLQKPFDEITADDIRLYLALRVQRDGISNVSANNERRALSSFYNWLHNEGIIGRNPMLRVDLIKEPKKHKTAFEPIEVEKLRNACASERERCIIEMLLSTWCRVSELAQIRIDEIEESKLTVHGKGAKDREVYLNAKAMIAVENYLKKRKDLNPYLFPRMKDGVNFSDRKSMSKTWYEHTKLVSENEHANAGTIESIVRNIGKRAKVSNVHPHRFRRTGATYALRQGMPLTIVSKLLGHENIGTTQIYLDISENELEQAHKKYVN